MKNFIENTCDVIHGYRNVIFDACQQSWVRWSTLYIDQSNGNKFEQFLNAQSVLFIIDFYIFLDNSSNNVAITLLLCNFYVDDFWYVNFFWQILQAVKINYLNFENTL